MADTVLIVITQTFGSCSWMVGATSLSLSWEENVCQILYDLNHLGIFHTSLAMWIFLSRVKTSYIHFILNESFGQEFEGFYIFVALYFPSFRLLTLFDVILIEENSLQPGYLLFTAAHFVFLKQSTCADCTFSFVIRKIQLG